MSTREQFKAWADDKFGPAPNPDIPQHERYASLFEVFQAGREQGLVEAVATISKKREDGLWAITSRIEMAAAIEALRGK